MVSGSAAQVAPRAKPPIASRYASTGQSKSALESACTVPRARERVCTRKDLLVQRRLPGRAEVVAVRARERLILHRPHRQKLATAVQLRN